MSVVRRYYLPKIQCAIPCDNIMHAIRFMCAAPNNTCKQRDDDDSAAAGGSIAAVATLGNGQAARTILYEYIT